MSAKHEIDLFINEPVAEDNVQGLYFFPKNQNIENFHKDINNTISSFSEDYLWHKDEFKVFLPLCHQKHEDLPLYLASITSFGDNIEDEWFIVYIILELTKKYKDLVVQIKDSDGDFLLIEAADHLPQWANPETTENRIFIHNNHFHLIPPEVADLDTKLNLKDAIKIVLQHPNKTQVSADIENSILNRIGKYPDKIKENTHIAAVKVPVEIAAVLQIKPNLIAPIVNAYCYQDVIDSKACKNISYKDWTTVSVKFTKCLYAMLMYSNHGKHRHNPPGNDKKTVLGLKLTHGYQIIMNKPSDIYSSKEYLKFINNLKGNGYFKENIEGSKEYKKLEQNARDFFSTVECPTSSNVAYVITSVMTSDEYSKVKDLFHNVKESNCVEDSDDWLTINPEDLNNMLNSRYGKKMKFRKGDTLTADAITSELNSFLKETSQYEGIETNQDQKDNSVDFDPDDFANCVEKMLKLISNGTESYESDDDEFMSQSEDEELDKELKERLHGGEENLSNNKTILENMIKSMKEEKASAGPSSNLISSVGLNKMDLLDSDDE